MPGSKRLKKLVLNAFELTVSFAHGALLMSGVLVVLLGAGYVTGGLDRYLPVKEAVAEEAVDVATDQDAGATLAELAAERQAVISYLVRKYRVSSLAIEPVVTAAHAAGAKLALDPLLIIAVMAIESRFNPFAESIMGAQGLMQVIPKYHQDKIAEHAASREELLDPAVNIQVGARVLKESIQRAGSVQAGLQQYNGAPWDSEAQYAAKVLAEKRRLEHAIRQHVRRAPLGVESTSS